MAGFRRQVFAVVGAAAALGLLGGSNNPGANAEQVLVAQLIDDIVDSDTVVGGDCSNGCSREVHATAFVAGTPQTPTCRLQTVTPFDSAVTPPGLLRASVYCEDVTGALIQQGTGPCIFDVCVDFRWTAGEGDEEGQLDYEVVIERKKKPRAAHTVYIDLSVAIDPTELNVKVDSCESNDECVVKKCTAPTSYMAKIVLTDSYGDGWVGGIPGYYNLWTLEQVGIDIPVSRGTLADNHDSSEVRECLEDGKYVFSTSATSAFSADMGWNICDQFGFAGEGLEFTVSGGQCTGFKKIERPTAEETSDADFGYCVLPAPVDEQDTRTSTCTTLSSGLKIDGVAMYYDDRCNSADYSGCGARSIDGCRLCFVDKELWLRRFPTSRVPDWPMCPCCVASVLGVDCATADSGGGTDRGVIIGVSVAIVGVIAIACCLSCAFGTTILRFFRRMKKRKNGPSLDDMDMDINGAAAFPDSPSNGGTIGHNHTGHRNRVHSGHFPIPRFDSIRGRFDSGIFASNNTGGYTSNAAAAAGGGAVVANGDVKKDSSNRTVPTAETTPSGTAKGSPNAPRSTVLDDRFVQKGFTSSDVGRPSSGAITAASATAGGGGTEGGDTRGAGGGRAGWGTAMSGEYPDLEGADPYAVDNALAETGTRKLRD